MFVKFFHFFRVVCVGKGFKDKFADNSDLSFSVKRVSYCCRTRDSSPKSLLRLFGVVRDGEFKKKLFLRSHLPVST
jgi:hypothetical protein